MKNKLCFQAIALWVVGLNFGIARQALADWVRHDPQNHGVIVFVHGVLGDGRGTWTSASGSYWPELLTHDHDFDGQNIYVFDYKTRLSGEAFFTIDEIADNMRTVLNAVGVLQEDQLVFVSHSMGGVVTCAFLLRNRDLSQKIRFLYFFGTPMTGSSWAQLGAALSRNNHQFGEILPITQDGDRFLPNLLSEWHSANFTSRSYCAWEVGKVFDHIVVDESSAIALCGPVTPIDANHFDMVKPKDQSSQPYLALKEAFDKTKPSAQPGPEDSNLLPKPVASKLMAYPKESLADRTFDLGEEIQRWLSKRTVVTPHNSEEQGIFRQEVAEYNRLFASRVLAVTDQLERCQANTKKIKAEEGSLASSINLVPVSGVAFELKNAADAIPEGQPRCGTGQPTQGFGTQKTGFYYLEIGSSSTGAFKRDLQKG